MSKIRCHETIVSLYDIKIEKLKKMKKFEKLDLDKIIINNKEKEIVIKTRRIDKKYREYEFILKFEEIQKIKELGKIIRKIDKNLIHNYIVFVNDINKEIIKIIEENLCE